jgi:hypothetical protein
MMNPGVVGCALGYVCIPNMCDCVCVPLGSRSAAQVVASITSPPSSAPSTSTRGGPSCWSLPSTSSGCCPPASTRSCTTRPSKARRAACCPWGGQCARSAVRATHHRPPPHQQLHPAAPIPTPFHPTPFHPTPFHPTPELAVERGRLLLHSADGLRWNLEGEWSSLAMGSAVSSSNEIVGVEASPLRRRRLGVHAHRGAIAADSSRHGGGGGLAEVSLSTSDPVVWTVALRPASAAPATAAPAAAAASR